MGGTVYAVHVFCENDSEKKKREQRSRLECTLGLGRLVLCYVFFSLSFDALLRINEVFGVRRRGDNFD